MNILHITDLHLDNFKGDKEFLRKGFYQEYINRLFNVINDKKLTVDFLIVTGDFVNVGKVENFKDIEIILKYLSDKFSIKYSNVCFCIGNHDYKWKELSKRTVKKEVMLKSNFKNFRDIFNNSFILDENYYYLSKLNDDTYFLSIDSTWNSKNGAPGVLKTSEEDILISSLLPIINDNNILLIGCHFPIISLDNNFLAGEEQDWHNKHIWIAGNSLRDRIKKIKTKATIWFHGDVHASDQKTIDEETFVLTSKFGGLPDKSEQKKQAILISINSNKITKNTCNYESPTHTQDPRLGDWNCTEKQKLRITKNLVKLNVTEEITFKAYNQEIEREILRLIKERELYKFGRFHVSEEYISLGWVNINKLMNDRDLLNRISDKSLELIKTEITDSKKNIFLLGVDIIGGVLASQLSVRLNVKNSVIPVRNKYEHYSNVEFSHSPSFDNIEKIKYLIIFIDIISSGSTINSIIEEIVSKNSKIEIHVISIISNDIKNRVTSIPNAKSYNTFCTNLRIPNIKHDEMPDETFVKPNLKF